MNAAQLRKRLVELETIAAKAVRDLKQAEAAVGEGRATGQALLHDLSVYETGVTTRRPGFVDSNETRRKLTGELVQKVIDGGYIAEPRHPGVPAHGLIFYDPGPAEQLVDLREARDRARLEARDFAAQHADTLREAEQAAVMARYRAALEGNDPYELAVAQRALPTIPDVNTLTTRDL